MNKGFCARTVSTLGALAFLLTACSTAPRVVVHEAGEAAAHTQPAQQVTREATIRAQWSASGMLLQPDGTTSLRVSRSEVEAEAIRIIVLHARSVQTWTELREIVTLACRLNDTYSLVATEDVKGKAFQAAAMAHVPGADVYSLIAELRAAKNSRDRVKAAAFYLLCIYGSN